MPLLPPNLKAARSRAPSTRSLVRRAGVPPDAAKGKRWWDTITTAEEAKKFVEQRPDLRDEAEQFLDVVATEDEHLGDLAKTARAYVTGRKLAHN